MVKVDSYLDLLRDSVLVVAVAYRLLAISALDRSRCRFIAFVVLKRGGEPPVVQNVRAATS